MVSARFMGEVYYVDFKSRPSFSSLAFSFLLSLFRRFPISGYVSDYTFQGRRAPVAAGLYFLETSGIILLRSPVPKRKRHRFFFFSS